MDTSPCLMSSLRTSWSHWRRSTWNLSGTLVGTFRLYQFLIRDSSQQHFKIISIFYQERDGSWFQGRLWWPQQSGWHSSVSVEDDQCDAAKVKMMMIVMMRRIMMIMMMMMIMMVMMMLTRINISGRWSMLLCRGGKWIFDYFVHLNLVLIMMNWWIADCESGSTYSWKSEAKKLKTNGLPSSITLLVHCD